MVWFEIAKKFTEEVLDKASKDEPTEKLFDVDSTSEVDAAEVEVWLPMKPYKLTLKHRILSELGELSHFILTAMYEYELNLDAIYKTTGLTIQQLDPVIHRLQGLGFMSNEINGSLTSEGRRVSSYLHSHLHNLELDVHIDQNYRSRDSKWLVLNSADPVLEVMPKNGIEIPLPYSFSRDFKEDRFLQAQRLSKDASQKISPLIPEHVQNFDESGSLWGKEWEFTLSKGEDDSTKAVRTSIPLKQYQGFQRSVDASNRSKGKGLKIYTSVLKLTTSFLIPSGAPWKDVNIPNSVECFYSESDEREYLDFEGIDNPEDGDVIRNSEGSDMSDASFSLLNLVNSKVSDEMNLFSINHEFSETWQCHEYSYDEVTGKIFENNETAVES